MPSLRSKSEAREGSVWDMWDCLNGAPIFFRHLFRVVVELLGIPPGSGPNYRD